MKLIVMCEGKPTRMIELRVGKYSFGRGNLNSVQLVDHFVSRNHFNIIKYSDDSVVLEDLGSKNGTLLNGKRVSLVAPLSIDDQIKVGNTTIRFIEEDVARQTTNVSMEWPKTSVLKKTTSILVWLGTLIFIGLVTFVLVFLLIMTL
jgi:pSer/pThr/pTyr-binding forkhead associated (FHA) protein